MAQLVKCPTLGFSSGHDLTVCGIKPHGRLCAESIEAAWDSLSPSLSAPPLHSLSLSLSLSINKETFLKNNNKKEKNQTCISSKTEGKLKNILTKLWRTQQRSCRWPADRVKNINWQGNYYLIPFPWLPKVITWLTSCVWISGAFTFSSCSGKCNVPSYLPVFSVISMRLSVNFLGQTRNGLWGQLAPCRSQTHNLPNPGPLAHGLPAVGPGTSP